MNEFLRWKHNGLKYLNVVKYGWEDIFDSLHLVGNFRTGANVVSIVLLSVGFYLLVLLIGINMHCFILTDILFYMY